MISRIPTWGDSLREALKLLLTLRQGERAGIVGALSREGSHDPVKIVQSVLKPIETPEIRFALSIAIEDMIRGLLTMDQIAKTIREFLDNEER